MSAPPSRGQLHSKPTLATISTMSEPNSQPLSEADNSTDSIRRPIKRVDAPTLEARMTDNAYQQILPARYLRRNVDGDIVEDPEELFERVAKNIALAEVVFEANKLDEQVTATPDQLKETVSDRDALASEVFGEGVTVDDDEEVILTAENINAFAYDNVVPALDNTAITEHVEAVYERFEDAMNHLDFMPNSPTLMNAGDELQQLSACFVTSPEDDMDDIGRTETDASKIFKSGGGVGYAFSRLRPYGDVVGSTGGIASGPLTFMRIYDKMCETIAQGGARRGAQMGVMRISHPDIIQFIHAKNKDVSLTEVLRLNDPDDYTHSNFGDALEEARELLDSYDKVPKHLRNAIEGHLSNFNISVGVTDEFMEALQNDDEFTFINPRTGEAHIATEETKEMYEWFDLGKYVEVGEELSIPANEIWDDIVEGAHQNGEPGVIYLDKVNDDHAYPVESTPSGDSSEYEILATNPCVTGDTEIVLDDGSTMRIDALAEAGDNQDLLTRENTKSELTVNTGVEPRLTGENAKVLTVTTEEGLSITCTPDHEIQTPRSYIEAGELEPGDQVITWDGQEPGEPVRSTLYIESIEDAGRADVYNITVDGTHNYFCRTDSPEGETRFINTANCGEQPLIENEACNLGHINLSTVAAADAPDWRAFEAANSELPLDEAVEEFLDEALNWDDLDQRIADGTRFLENVVTMSAFPIEEISETVSENRKIGLGVMGLAQLYIQLGVKYGSETGNEVARQVMTHINHGSKTASHALADERGPFSNWEDSKYANPTEYPEWFERQTGRNASEWEDGFPLRNYSTTTIAPTGTTSMLGNTTGGCEPIFNVAFYKNVSDDVQGDEMLVEWDDYFIRVLEANDIDVDAVKTEAKEQMAANEFDGVDSLETVPNAIGDLFVVTSDLSGKEHAAVQCAMQEGVDSAISKTSNFPNSATIEDMDEVYRYIYENGGKGVTVYRDGTRSKQVLTTRADNRIENADPEEVLDQVGKLAAEGEIEPADVAAVLEDAFEERIDELIEQLGGTRKRPRPDVLRGVTQRIKTGYGKVYININEDKNGQPFELFANMGSSGGFTNSFTESLAKTISTALRSGVDPEDIADQLQGIRSPKVAWDQGTQVHSVPDAMGQALRRYLDGEIHQEVPQQRNLSEVETEATSGQTDASEQDEETNPADAKTDGGVGADSGVSPESQQAVIDAGESPECPSCGSFTLYYSEGCKSCESCGWSEC